MIFQNQFHEKMLSYELLAPLADAYSKDATSLVRVIKHMEDGLAKTQLIQAYADSTKAIWIVMCALAGVAGVSSCFINGYGLDPPLVTAQGFAPGEKKGDVEQQVALESQ